MPRFFADALDAWVTATGPSVRGGEGEVSPCRENPGWLLKVHHRPPPPEYGMKVGYLVALAARIGRDRLALPLSALRPGPGGPTVGCLLRRVPDAVPLDDVLNPKWRADVGVTLRPDERIRLAAWYAENLALAHRHRLVRSDFNLGNEFVALDGGGNPAGLESIDTDGYGVTGIRGPAGGLIDVPVTIGVEEFVAPEQLAGQEVATVSGDRFLAAMALFVVLTDDHPTAGVVAPDAANSTVPERIRQGLFPALRHDPRAGIAEKGWGSGIRPADFPGDVMGLFFDALVAGHARPDERPTLDAWATALETWAAAATRRPRFPRVRRGVALAVLGAVGIGAAAALLSRFTSSGPGTGPALWRAAR